MWHQSELSATIGDDEMLGMTRRVYENEQTLNSERP